jgi:hypothetical protein
MAERYKAEPGLGLEDTEIFISSDGPAGSQQKQVPSSLPSDTAASQRRPVGGSALALRAQFSSSAQIPSSNLQQQTVAQPAAPTSSTSTALATHPQLVVSSDYQNDGASTSAASTQQEQPVQAFEGDGFQEVCFSRASEPLCVCVYVC